MVVLLAPYGSHWSFVAGWAVRGQTGDLRPAKELYANVLSFLSVVMLSMAEMASMAPTSGGQWFCGFELKNRVLTMWQGNTTGLGACSGCIKFRRYSWAADTRVA
jgi:hypothetical protein